jgi:membrane protease YdiL (CAAX protease family)
VTAGNGRQASLSNRPPGRDRPGWKSLLALVSLALSALLWLNGLAESLSRPSVGSDLNLRQLELAALAQSALPHGLRPLLAGKDPEGALQEALSTSLNRSAETGAQPAPEQRLELALLQQRRGQVGEARTLLQELLDEGDDPKAAALHGLARQLLNGSGQPRPWPEQRPLLQHWICEATESVPSALTDASCPGPALARRAASQLLAVTLVPALVLLVGIALLLRQLWLMWRGRLPGAPPLQGPPLQGLDAVLLIAGGFVVIGELLTPLLVTPLLADLLHALAITSPLKEGITVLAMYAALMAGPLVILALMLRGLGPGPEGGWLHYRWRPLPLSAGRALQGLLLVLPLVSLVGWLQGQLWDDPGGSNPLLDLVLRSQQPAALACFALTAVVLAPLFEETIFRGVLLPVVGRELGPQWGVVISAAVFAVAHLSLGELPPLLMLGLGLGWLRWRTGSLGSCVLMHALWNGLTFSNLVILGS